LNVTCPRCGCPIPASQTLCPNCGQPKPPPAAGPDFQARNEARAVGIFGAIMTASLLALVGIVLIVGGFMAIVMGCLGSCANGLNGRPNPPVDNPLMAYIGPIIAGIVVLWVVLSIVVFVILRRRQR